MKKYTCLTILALFVGSLVFTASNQAQIKKLNPVTAPLEEIGLLSVSHLAPSFYDQDLLVILVENSHRFSRCQTLVLKLDFLVPDPITISPAELSYLEWKPWGKVNTKYHAPWLFEPVKLC